MKKFLIILLFVVSCADEYTYREIAKEPSKEWIGKTVIIKFGQFGNVLSNKEFKVKIVAIETTRLLKKDEKSEKYFLTEQAFHKTYKNRIYFEWFKLGFGKGIVSCKEVIKKNRRKGKGQF